MAQLSDSLLGKDTELFSKPAQHSELENQAANFSENLVQALVQNAIEKQLFECVRNSLALLRTAAHKCNSNFIRERKKTITDRAAVHVQFRK